MVLRAVQRGNGAFLGERRRVAGAVALDGINSFRDRFRRGEQTQAPAGHGISLGPVEVLTTTFLLIGYLAAATSPLDGTVITGGPSDAPATAKIIQCVTQDLLLRNGCFNGQAAIFPFPHHAPFI